MKAHMLLEFVTGVLREEWCGCSLLGFSFCLRFLPLCLFFSCLSAPFGSPSLVFSSLCSVPSSIFFRPLFCEFSRPL